MLKLRLQQLEDEQTVHCLNPVATLRLSEIELELFLLEILSPEFKLFYLLTNTLILHNSKVFGLDVTLKIQVLLECLKRNKI